MLTAYFWVMKYGRDFNFLFSLFPKFYMIMYCFCNQEKIPCY